MKGFKRLLSLLLAVLVAVSCGLSVQAKEQDTDVLRIYGQNRYQTSFAAADALKDALGITQFSAVIIASGTEFADALSGSYLAAVKKAPILLYSGGNDAHLKAYIQNNLVPGGTVYLLGGMAAIPSGMEKGLGGFTVKRLGGQTRYETNVAILNEAGVAGKDVLVCTGLGFADSLSASASSLPILLVGEKLGTTQRKFLAGVTGKLIVVGGTSAVSEFVENQLKVYTDVERLGGADRYETSVLLAKRFFNAPEKAVLAYAKNFPDGLCAGILAVSAKAPLILTANGKTGAAAAYTQQQGVRGGYVLGGPGLLTDSSVREIFSMAGDAVPQVLTGTMIQSLEFENNLYKVKPGAVKEPVLTVQPEGSGENILWTSSDPSIAAVDANGKVTGVKYGTVTITATCEISGKHVSCQVKVCDVKQVAITFDDGPSKQTARLLDFLKENNIKATFFLVGEMIPYYKETVKRQAAEGHEIGYHSYAHVEQTTLKSDQIIKEFKNTNQKLLELTGQEFTVWRAPGGGISDRVLKCIELPHIMWSLDTLDWKYRNADRVCREILNKSKDGTIILCHDLYASTVEGSIRAMKQMLEGDYEFLTVTELLSRDGTPPENSVSYNRG